MNKYKADLEKEIEEIRKKHKVEIEIYKADLEKARSDYNKYSSKKFEIIEETWTALFNIIKELKVYNLNEGNYVEFLQKTLNVISDYLLLIRKNSLYFNDDLRKLLNDYVSLSTKTVSDASEKIKKAGSFEDKANVSEIMQGIYDTAIKRDKLLNDIRQKFKQELGAN